VASQPDHQIDNNTVYRATITTDRGAIVMDLDPQLAPTTVNNFVVLARQGYYDGLTFHRAEPFVIQVVAWGTGRGGPGYKFATMVQGDYVPGAVAMANAVRTRTARSPSRRATRAVDCRSSTTCSGSWSRAWTRFSTRRSAT
jgi:hypothetical protein